MRNRSIALALVVAASAHAQVTIPPGLEPGQIRRGLQEMRSPEHQALQSAPAAPVQVAPAATAAVKFVLRDVTVDGVTVYPPAELTRVYSRFIGREIPVAQVFDIANELTARYRRDGYTLSQVLVPAQDVTAGRVRLVAVEGYVDAIQLRGAAAPDDARLTAYGAQLRRTRPLTSAALERYLLLINDLANVSSRGTLVPSANVPGAADLIVDVKRDYTSVTLAANNRGSRSLGARRLDFGLESYGLLGQWDHAGLQAGSSLDDRLTFAGLSYGGPVGDHGLQWTSSVTGVRSRPGRAANLATDELATKSLSAELGLRAPLLRSRSQNLALRAALSSFDGRSEFSSADLSRDGIRALRLGLSWDLADRARGITTLDLDVARGLDVLGARLEGSADAPLSRAGGRADFTKTTLYLARLQSLGSSWGGQWSALMAFSAQHAFDTLLAPELFAFGGDTFGRGYDPSELAGDSGEALKVELRFAGYAPAPGISGYSVYGFYDAGRVRHRELVDEADSEHASAAGFGLRLSARRWQGLVEYAIPLDHEVAAEGNRDARVFFGVQAGM